MKEPRHVTVGRRQQKQKSRRRRPGVVASHVVMPAWHVTVTVAHVTVSHVTCQPDMSLTCHISGLTCHRHVTMAGQECQAWSASKKNENTI